MENLADRARLANLKLIPSRIRHIGTENCQVVLDQLRKSLVGRVETRTCCPVQSLLAEDGRIRGVKLESGETITGQFVVAAPGAPVPAG